MKKVVLTRIESSDQGTFGLFSFSTVTRRSLELPWRSNSPRISCIKSGIYEARWLYSPKLKRCTYRLTGIPGRSSILIHPANLAGDKAKGFKSQLEGCIALGEKVGTMDRQKAILLSTPAVREFETWAAGEPLQIEIQGVV